MKTLSGRKSVEVNQFDIADASLLDALRGKKCYTGVNQMTKPMMKFMSAGELAAKPVLSDEEKKEKKKAKKDKKAKKKKSKKSKKSKN